MNNPEAMNPWRELWVLSWPVAFAMLATMSMGLVDMVMLGRLGPEALAALSLSITWWVTVGVLSRNISKGLDPFVSQAFGAKRLDEVRQWLPQGLYASAVLAPPYMFMMIFAATGLRLLNQPEELMGNVAIYCRVLALAVPAELAFHTLRQWLQNQHRVQEAMIAIVAANILNIGCNWLLIYSLDMGVTGCALATLTSQYAQLAILSILCWRKHLKSVVQSWASPKGTEVWKLLKYAIPISGVIAVESWGFVAATVMVGWIGTTALAAHSIGLNIVSTSFMVVLGLSSAAGTLVGNAIGAGRPWTPIVRRALLGMGSLQLTFACLLWVFPRMFAGVFTQDPEVIEMCVIVLRIGALFQLFDGIQVMLFSVLRALGDVKIPFWGGFIAHWFIGLPMAYRLSQHEEGGIAGVWYGLLIALCCAAAFVSVRVFQLSRREVQITNKSANSN